MTLSDPTAHSSSSLFYGLKYLSLMICTSYQSRYLHMNAKTTLPHFISLTFSFKLLMYTLTKPEVLLVETFLSCKKALCSMSYDPCFNGTMIWNFIPPEIRHLSTFSTLKNNLKNLFFDSYI